MLGPLQTVQRAEFWEVVLALQATDAVHLGVNNLNVVRHVGRLLDGVRSSCPADLLNDGDLIMLTGRILKQRGRVTVRVSKVKEHADEEMVRIGQVQELDWLGKDAGDEDADFGRRRVDHVTFQVFVGAGTLLCYSAVASFLYCHLSCGGRS